MLGNKLTYMHLPDGIRGGRGGAGLNNSGGDLWGLEEGSLFYKSEKKKIDQTSLKKTGSRDL